ncbi:hypothetical protein [Nonomuraea sp. NPDC002799]
MKDMADQKEIVRLLSEIGYRSLNRLDPAGEDTAKADALKAFLRASPRQFEIALLHAWSENVLTQQWMPDVVRHVLSLDRLLGQLAADSLPTVFGIAQGLIDAEYTRRDLGLASWKSSSIEDSDLSIKSTLAPQASQIAVLWHTLAMIASLSHGYTVERNERLCALEREVAAHPESWARSIPWILTVGPSLSDLDVALTLWLRERYSRIDDDLRDIEALSFGRISLRARGIQTLVTGREPVISQDWLLNAAAKLLDERRNLFPRPLEAPSSTWLGDANVESLIRGAADRAVQEFADIVAADGAAEEEYLTPSLLALLSDNIDAVKAALVLAGVVGSSPKVEVERRIVPKSEEKEIGADIGVVVSIQVPAHATITYGDLVQIKKSKLLRKPGPGSDSWAIAIGQLEELLRCSATAVYWLIAQSGVVYVVPAKMILALRHGRGKPNAGSFTVRYSDIRHVAIKLGHYFCDVLLGMWVASSNPETLAIADGSNARTSPRHLFRVSVRIGD